MKPILFNSDMVRSILDGRKMVTRRVVKPNGIFQGWSILGRDKSMIQTPNGFGFLISNGEKSVETLMYMPYRPGDILYVRETFSKERVRGKDIFVYKTGDENAKILQEVGGRIIKWRPSIHMPREAARIFLRVTDVRVERLQDIDDSGVVAEGLEIGAPFDELWDRTIKPAERNLHGWNANPWVWVIFFERISKEEATP